MKIFSGHIKSSLKENKGITLTELIVASVMIGIVMIGVSSFGLTIKKLQSSTNSSALLSMKAKTIMARMSVDALATIGDVPDPGYVTSGGGPDVSICFRHDVNTTPSLYTDDEWTCYYRDAQNILSLCTVPTVPGNVPPSNDGECDGSGTRNELIDMTQADFYDIFEVGIDNRLEYFDLHISAIYDNTTAMDPITNPEYFVSTRISPPGQSR